jgi:predicted transcriptional regulator
MTDRTITLRADLVERLESLAQRQARSLDEVLDELLNTYAPEARGNWALAVARGMEAADIDWIDDPDASVNSRAHFERHLREQWERTQRDA